MFFSQLRERQGSSDHSLRNQNLAACLSLCCTAIKVLKQVSCQFNFISHVIIVFSHANPILFHFVCILDNVQILKGTLTYELWFGKWNETANLIHLRPSDFFQEFLASNLLFTCETAERYVNLTPLWLPSHVKKKTTPQCLCSRCVASRSPNKFGVRSQSWFISCAAAHFANRLSAA